MKAIDGVPESLTREQYVSLIESVGFEAKFLRSLEFRMDGIYADVMERGEGDGVLLDRGSDEVVMNRVFIPVLPATSDHQVKSTLD